MKLEGNLEERISRKQIAAMRYSLRDLKALRSLNGELKEVRKRPLNKTSGSVFINTGVFIFS